MPDIVVTSIQSLGNGAGSVWVRIKNPYAKTDIHMEIPIENLNGDISGILNAARIKVFQFATELAASADPPLRFE